MTNDPPRITSRSPRRPRLSIAVVLGMMVLGTGGVAAEKVLDSGRAVGQRVPSFYVRAVTGPLRNKSVCYVCRNGTRPCVMVIFRDLEPGLSGLLQQIDKLVDRNRAVGLRSFGVLISNQPGQAISRLQTLAFNEKISLPLTVTTDAVSTPACQNIHPQAAVTVVLYHRQRVIRRFAFRANELKTTGTKDVLTGIRRLLGES